MGALTGLSILGLPQSNAGTIADHPVYGLPPVGTRIPDFDTWRPGYAGVAVLVYDAGTTTAAPLYYDPLLTVPAPNPQTLLSLTDVNGTTYGKWLRPIYTYVAYSLFINGTATTGIERPAIVQLDGEDASAAIASSRRGAYPVALEDWFDEQITATGYGAINSDNGSAINTTTLVAAIGAAAAQGGGEVRLPASYIPFTTLTLPEGVVLVGQGASTVLSSSETNAVITLSGDNSGLRNLTLDGVDLVAGSIGVYGVAVTNPIFENVTIKRFETPIRFKGAAESLWRNLSLDNNTNGADLRGDADVAATNNGDEFHEIVWDGGSVTNSVVAGIVFRFYDLIVREVTLRNVLFENNAGVGALVSGARGIAFEQCNWRQNITNLTVQDDTNTALVASNTSARIRVTGGQMVGGTCTFNGTCEDVQLERVDIQNVSFNLSVPLNPIFLKDCKEDANSTATGYAVLLQRVTSTEVARIGGVTTDATILSAWTVNLNPGDVMYLQGTAIAKQRNGTQYAVFNVTVGAYRPDATLAYISQTSNFTVGQVVSGKTSGASALIAADNDTGSSGTLTLRSITGVFLLGEILTDTAGGAAVVGGALATSNAALDPTSNTVVHSSGSGVTGSSWAALWNVSGSLVRFGVQGAAGQNIDWLVEVNTGPR